MLLKTKCALVSSLGSAVVRMSGLSAVHFEVMLEVQSPARQVNNIACCLKQNVP